jgi:DNA-binding NtrC family response regulator
MNQSKKSILIVDDEQDIGIIMKRSIEREADFEVTYINNPVEALSRFKRGLCDIVLIDIRMPQMDGFELYLKMKKIDDKIKACFLTAFEIDRFMYNKQKYPELQEICFIKKPVTMKELIESIRRRLLE